MEFEIKNLEESGPKNLGQPKGENVEKYLAQKFRTNFRREKITAIIISGR